MGRNAGGNIFSGENFIRHFVTHLHVLMDCDEQQSLGIKMEKIISNLDFFIIILKTNQGPTVDSPKLKIKMRATPCYC